MHYYNIAPTKIAHANSESFTYSSSDRLRYGQIAMAPLGNQAISGIVINDVPKPKFITKEINKVIYKTPLPSQLVDTAIWISKYYSTPLATVLSNILPQGINKNRREKLNEKEYSPIRNHTTLSPTSGQKDIIKNITDSGETTQILNGITGSGKTLIYIKLAKIAYDVGKSSIILVPEIALTPQLTDEFKNTFGEDALVIHSKQSEATRHKTWQACLNASRPKIIVGPRSALFVPIKKIGLIVIDEFHEPTYKQEKSPRYSAIRVATTLAKKHEAKVLLGSASPSVSEYYIAKKNNAPIHKLHSMAVKQAKKPDIKIIDMKKKDNFIKHRFLSDELLRSINKALDLGKQTLIFHNRRGTTAITICNDCGWTATDPKNDLPLTLHADKHLLISHVSDFNMRVPTKCPECGGVEIIHKGIGTKLLETELGLLYPNKKIARFDKDTSSNNNINSLYKNLYDGDIDIIIGTQVVAKGLDLPNLHTVGVVQADTGLILPDYTSDERVFQLLSQVIGRVGRTPSHSEAIVQTYKANHPSISLGVQQNFDDFYEYVIKERKNHNFPPYVFLLKLICSYKTERTAIQNSRKLQKHLKTKYPDIIISGPAPCFYEKQNGSYRWQLILKSKSRSRLQQIILDTPKNNWQYELDPTSLL